jgi:PAS domain S-box-containing protein
MALFEGSPHSILVVDPRSCVILSANPAAARQYGYTEAEFKGLRLESVWPRAGQSLRSVSGSGGRSLKTWRHRRKNGEWMHVTVAAQDVSMEERPALALHVSDVTDRALSVALLEGQGRVLEMVARGSPLRRVLSELVRGRAAARLGSSPHANQRRPPMCAGTREGRLAT